MAVPKRKTTQSRKGMRRSHDAISAPALSIDKKTKSVHRPHHVDLKTGFYRGKQVLFDDDAEG
jgi:large subunit ribosomal protein L32